MQDLQFKVGELVQLNLAFHNLNKATEDNLGLSLVQYYLLNLLRDMPGCAPQRLANAAGMHPSTLTQSMKRFLRKKLIYVEEDPRDSRKKILGITICGHTALIKFEENVERLFHIHEETTNKLSLKLKVMQN